MEPWEVINSREDGPYAIRTLLRWVINGPLQGRRRGVLFLETWSWLWTPQHLEGHGCLKESWKPSLMREVRFVWFD